MERMNLRPYQRRAVEWSKCNDGLIVAPAGSGKTWIAAAILRHHMEGNTKKAGWLAPTIETCEQGMAAAELAGVGDRVEVRCPHKSVDFSDKEILIVDEAKRSPAATLAAIINPFKGLRYGFDATPWHDSDKERNDELKRMFPSIFVITREDVGDALVDATVILKDDSDDNLERRIDANIDRLMSVRSRYMRISKDEMNAMCAWESIVDIGIAGNALRNKAAIDFANDNAGKQRLILVPRVTLGEDYERKIPSSLLLHSGVAKKARREAVQAFRAGDLSCIVATSLADEGLDLPNVEVLVMLSGGRSSQKTIQRASRALRVSPGQKMATILDFRDRFHPIAMRQAMKRIQTYRSLGCIFGGGNKFVVSR